MSKLRRKNAGEECSPREVRRTLRGWIDDAVATLQKKRITDADIHDARKLLKKSRSALRLLRDAIGEIAYERENAALRDAARPLGVARDSKVLIASLDALAERYLSAAQSKQLDKFRGALRKEQMRTKRALGSALITKQRVALRSVSKRMNRWKLPDADDSNWEIIGAGLVRVYRDGRKRFVKARRSRGTIELHDWRKQVKYLWHQLQILRPVWPGMIGELADQCHKLSADLGDDHDLAVLKEKIGAHSAAFEAESRDALLALLDRRRARLQDKAFVLGARIYEEKPKQFGRRMGKYWRVTPSSRRAGSVRLPETRSAPG